MVKGVGTGLFYGIQDFRKGGFTFYQIAKNKRVDIEPDLIFKIFMNASCDGGTYDDIFLSDLPEKKNLNDCLEHHK